MSACNVCNTEHSAPVYLSAEDISITSLFEVRAGRTEVFFCANCGQLQTTLLPDLDNYYDKQYRFLSDNEEEDDLYKIVNGEKIFRVPHQIETLLRKVDLPLGARVLDYGCAKGASARLLAEIRPDLQVHLFDVCETYLPFWERFSTSDRWATHDVPAAWNGQFDAVFSVYVAEHVADPILFARQMSSLLKPGGTLYWLVANVAANPADFIVADHFSHFSEHSVMTLMQRAGLKLREVDCHSHEAGLIVIADLHAAESSFRPRTTLTEWHADVLGIASYWSQLGGRIRRFEQQRPANEAVAIYGSGFYGTFIASCLENTNNVSCFLDQNPFRQGKELLGRPIISPQHLDASIRTVYVGLNPRAARKIIGDIDVWRDRDLEMCFLSEDESTVRKVTDKAGSGILEGQKIILRLWYDADLDFFGLLRNDVETQLVLLAQPRPNPANRVRQWLEDRSSAADGLFFVIATKPDGRAVGFVELRDIHATHGWGHLGICLDRAARGRGFAVEAMELLESYARRVLMLRKIVLTVAANNTVARHLYDSTGYSTVGTHREHYHVGGKWLDAVVMEKSLGSNDSRGAATVPVARNDQQTASDGRNSPLSIQGVSSP